MRHTSVATIDVTTTVLRKFTTENFREHFFGELHQSLGTSAKDLRVALAKLEGEGVIKYRLSPSNSVPNNEGVDPRGYYTLA